jgi:hypothetical protein
MRRARRYIGYVAAGLAFWIPGVVVHAIRGREFGGSRLDLLAVLALPVVTSTLAVEMLYRKHQSLSRRGTIALWLLLGIWVFGPLCMTIGATFSGGGFTQPEGWRMLLLGIPLFVPLTFMMSTYDGTLGALGVVTIWFVVFGVLSFVRRAAPRPVPKI